MFKRIAALLPVLLFLFSLINLNGCKDESNPSAPPSDHFEPEGWFITAADSSPVLVIWQGEVQAEWNGVPVADTLSVPLNGSTPYYFVKFLSGEKAILNPPDEEGLSLGFVITNSGKISAAENPDTKWSFRLNGLIEGETSVELQVLHGGHADIRTPKIPARVR